MATRKKAGVKKPAEMEAVTDEPVAAVAPPEVAEEKPAEPPPIEQAANVIWRGEGEPPKEVRIGISRIVVPDAETQRAGFYSPDAERLARQIKGYKRFNHVKP